MSEYFIGRQPIFDHKMDLYAYELLFRGEDGRGALEKSGEEATSQVMHNALAEIGLNNLIGNKRAFLNLTHRFITDPDLILFPPEQTVLEVLEDVKGDDSIVAGVDELSQRGYTIALDDFVYRPDLEPLIDLADLIKIDITQFDDDGLAEAVKSLKSRNKPLLAERVETAEELEKLQALEFDYYQGYFFAKPKVVRGKKLPGNMLALVQLASKIHEPDIDMDELVRLVSMDISLSVKTLRFANSAQNGLQTKVENVRQAVNLLGLKTLRNWISILLMSEIDYRPSELVTLALTRARFCENLAREAELENADSFFTVGLFSVLDALLDTDMETILDSLPLQAAICDALLHHRGLQGDALNIAMDFEVGHLGDHTFAEVDAARLNALYLDALKWADESVTVLQ